MATFNMVGGGGDIDKIIDDDSKWTAVTGTKNQSGATWSLKYLKTSKRLYIKGSVKSGSGNQYVQLYKINIPITLEVGSDAAFPCCVSHGGGNYFPLAFFSNGGNSTQGTYINVGCSSTDNTYLLDGWIDL